MQHLFFVFTWRLKPKPNLCKSCKKKLMNDRDLTNSNFVLWLERDKKQSSS